MYSPHLHTCRKWAADKNDAAFIPRGIRTSTAITRSLEGDFFSFFFYFAFQAYRLADDDSRIERMREKRRDGRWDFWTAIQLVVELPQYQATFVLKLDDCYYGTGKFVHDWPPLGQKFNSLWLNSIFSYNII